MCSAYRKRHDVFVQECAEQFGDEMVLHGRGAGLHFLLEFPDGTNIEQLMNKAEEVGVRVYSVQPFWKHADGHPNNLIFIGYSLLDEVKIRQGIGIIRHVWFDEIK